MYFWEEEDRSFKEKKRSHSFNETSVNSNSIARF